MILPPFALIWASLLTPGLAAGDWFSSWDGPERVLDSAFEVDPGDARAMMRGSGEVRLGNGIAIFKNSPRLYISQESGVDGWENVEITAYGKYVDQGGEPLRSYSGLTLVTRSNHDEYKTDGCEAFGYYARIYQESGECAFQKEYFHGSSGTVYSPTKRVQCFSGGLPLGQWVGMKFKVTTVPDTSDVDLELYLDENDDGNWQLRHSVRDTPGYWFSSSSTTVPSECPQNDGDTVIRPGSVSFLRTDGRDLSTEVHWRNVTMINSLSTSTDPPTNAPITPSPTTPPTNAPVASPVTMSPTGSPVQPTNAPTKAPSTSSPTRTPTNAPTDFPVITVDCSNDPDWRTRRNNNKLKNCNWVKRRDNRCGTIGTDGTPATVACPETCDAACG